MWLPKVERGQGLKHRLMFTAMRVVKRTRVPDMVRIITYRPGLFGKPCGQLHNALLRRESAWSVAERELFAAHVSEANRCNFCVSAHRAIASCALGGAPLPSELSTLDHPAIGLGARAMLPFLAKLALTPDQVGPDDLAPARAAGVSEQAIVDAIYICAEFALMNRVADALGCEPLTPRQREVFGKLLHDQGYDL